jgi:hypothetical protein
MRSLLKPRDSHSHSDVLRWDASARRAILREALAPRAILESGWPLGKTGKSYSWETIQCPGVIGLGKEPHRIFFGRRTVLTLRSHPSACRLLAPTNLADGIVTILIRGDADSRGASRRSPPWPSTGEIPVKWQPLLSSLFPLRHAFGTRLPQPRTPRPISDRARPRRRSCRANSTTCMAASGGSPRASPPRFPDDRAV